MTWLDLVWLLAVAWAARSTVEEEGHTCPSLSRSADTLARKQGPLTLARKQGPLTLARKR